MKLSLTGNDVIVIVVGVGVVVVAIIAIVMKYNAVGHQNRNLKTLVRLLLIIGQFFNYERNNQLVCS